MNTPLLPRSCPVPTAGFGEAHSMCSCTSPKASRVLSCPVPGTTSNAPSTMRHFAGVPVPDAHLSSDAPPNRIVASFGGAIV